VLQHTLDMRHDSCLMLQDAELLAPLVLQHTLTDMTHASPYSFMYQYVMSCMYET
jgi:hypothetical protein